MVQPPPLAQDNTLHVHLASLLSPQHSPGTQIHTRAVSVAARSAPHVPFVPAAGAGSCPSALPGVPKYSLSASPLLYIPLLLPAACNRSQRRPAAGTAVVPRLARVHSSRQWHRARFAVVQERHAPFRSRCSI